jgi:mRNA-degrading endonuclease toxin of MazEF toxin-antitoxin module
MIPHDRLAKQGDIVLITLDPTVGTEIQGKRPVLVLSNSEFNRGGRALVAAMIVLKGRCYVNGFRDTDTRRYRA